MTYRRSGDDNLLVEYGPMTARPRRCGAGARAGRAPSAEGGCRGIIDLTPGIRSLQVHVDPDVLPIAQAARRCCASCERRPARRPHELVVPSRTVRLPLSWDDPATREAIERYMAGVRDDAPWCPWNIEFIRRVNGLASVDDVYRTVFDAEYLVLGLGDVYLGAPVATPLDPRHRLVTTKYNPARTWTAENSVGIGGAYLCIYGMEGPGGYQFVGRTVQVWNRWQQRGAFEPGTPWLLRFFDRISWYPGRRRRTAGPAGRHGAPARCDARDRARAPSPSPSTRRFLADNAESIAAFRATQAAAFEAERRGLGGGGRVRPEPNAAPRRRRPRPGRRSRRAATSVEARSRRACGRSTSRAATASTAGQALLALEAMKMETRVPAPAGGDGGRQCCVGRRPGRPGRPRWRIGSAGSLTRTGCPA